MTPDIILHNGALITFDESQPSAGALAIGAGTILAVGDAADILPLAGPDTKVMDAKGATVLPGFIDSHVHLFAGAVEMTCLNLYGAHTLQDMQARIRPHAKGQTADTMVFCVMADYGVLGTGDTPPRVELDQILPNRPLAMFAADHHTVWANTPALEAAGLLQGREVEAGSEVRMWSDGKASGELSEPGAYGPVLALTRHGGRDMLGLVTGRDPEPPATLHQREMDKDVIAAGLRHCATQGITGLHLMDGNTYQLELLSELEREGRLPCRCMVPFHFKGSDDIARIRTEGLEMRNRFQGDKIWCGHMKMFIDGVVEGGTALMLEPYPGEMGQGGNCGEEVFTQDHFIAATVEADKHGFQIAVHSIGDAGVRRTIDAFGAARDANGPRDARHRIEHLELVHPDDMPRLAALDIVASVQPGHAPRGHIFPAEGVGHHLHPHQIDRAYAWRDLRAHAAKLVFSTDWPVMPVDVMPNIRAAIAPLDLGPAWREHSQSLMDTLASYTRDNAWVEFNEDRKGKLKPGMMADVVVMSHDLTSLPADQITQASATLTICDGVVTYRA